MRDKMVAEIDAMIANLNDIALYSGGAMTLSEVYAAPPKVLTSFVERVKKKVEMENPEKPKQL